MKKLGFVYQALIATFVVVIFASCAQDQTTSQTKQTPKILTSSKTLSGSYLAGRFAQRHQDWETAQHYMNDVIEHDKNNTVIEQRTFLLTLGSGNFDQTKNIAKKITTSENKTSELALIFLASDALKTGDFKSALKYIDLVPEDGFGQYTKPLLKAWTLVGLDKKDEAIKILTNSEMQMDSTYRMHLGLIEELNENMKSAETHYRVVMANGLELHTAIMIANFYERYDMKSISDTIHENLDKVYSFKPFTRATKRKNGEKVKPNITTVADGAALVMLDLTTLLYSKRAYDSAKIYGNLVRFLDEDSPFINLILGDISALHSQYNNAVNFYNAIEKTSALYWLSRNRVSEVYEINGEYKKSIKILREMAKDASIKVQVLSSIGDTYRRNSQFKKAINAYNEALADVDIITDKHWPIVYARGIAKEKVTSWDHAESDILKALEFQPQNPMILNFVAYSWAEKDKNLDKALEYVKRAEELKPYDAYILDSYGWVLFHKGNYQAAIEKLEQAVELMPDDEAILDHLGDAYWQDNQKNTARKYWTKAGNISKDPTFKKTVSSKITNGIITSGEIEKQSVKK
ncbi:MAG: tetratricopeptide repeat protein [Proteobacteria bacterium]|nr:tetratricopeptide repeat protein [Pseudomonadota bacterium]